VTESERECIEKRWLVE